MKLLVVIGIAIASAYFLNYLAGFGLLFNYLLLRWALIWADLWPDEWGWMPSFVRKNPAPGKDIAA